MKLPKKLENIVVSTRGIAEIFPIQPCTRSLEGIEIA